MHLGKNLFEEHKLLKTGLNTGEIIRQYKFQTRQAQQKIDIQKLRFHFEVFVLNIYKRYQLKLFKGKLDYLIQLQTLLDYYISIQNSETEYFIQKLTNITGLHASKNTSTIQVKCSKCQTYTNPQPFNCNICCNAFYCGQSCRINHKYVHSQKQCKQNPFPKIITSLQIQVHLGGDLGQNLQIYYQHQSRITFAMKGKSFLKKINNSLSNSKQLKNQCQVINNKQYLVIQKLDENQNKDKQSFTIKTFEDLCQLYLNDPILYEVKIMLLLQGCILVDTVKEIYNTHLRIILIFSCPV